MAKLKICNHTNLYYDDTVHRVMTFELECLECRQTRMVIITPTQQTVHTSVGTIVK